jgi:hypothetical protein
MNKNKWINGFIIGTFVSLYALVSIVSTIHVIDFFELSNPYWLAVTLAIGFELGAAASLAAILTLDKMNKTLVWGLFIAITAMQMQGNMYHAFININEYQKWVELFNLIEWEPLAQKRLLATVSGAILPLVALGFIKSLVDYIRPDSSNGELSAKDLGEIAADINESAKKKSKIEEDSISIPFTKEEEDKLWSHNYISEKDLGIKVDRIEVKDDIEEAPTEVLEEPIKEPALKITSGKKGPLYDFRTSKRNADEN